MILFFLSLLNKHLNICLRLKITGKNDMQKSLFLIAELIFSLIPCSVRSEKIDRLLIVPINQLIELEEKV